ncbi:MAG: DUF3631 domain-containing protein [Gammaproteobacteria bacterium]
MNAEAPGQAEGHEKTKVEQWIAQVLEKFSASKGAEELPPFLADLKPIDYDLIRKPLAEKMGVRPTALDEERNLERRRRGGNDEGGQGQDLNIDDPEPWEVAVDGATLLNELAFTFRRHAVLPRHGDKVLALWALHTYACDFRDCTPILALTSPQKRCGKTTVVGLLSELVSRPLPASNITSAAVFRAINKHRPSLLIDEVDTFLPENQELRGVLNCGHTRRGSYIIRPVGEDHDPKSFTTWAPKALALIGKLPSTLADRSITIVMQRRLPGERIERLNRFDGLTLRRKCVRWVQNYHPWISEADPEVPAILNDRAADNWRPLLALADLAGGRWPKRARQAALAFGDQEDESAGVLLLSDLRDLFRERKTDRLSSSEVVEHLATLEDRPWPEWGRSRKPITKNVLAGILKPFKVKPTQLWINGGKDRGYHLKLLKRVFDRYLPPDQNGRTVGLNNHAGFGDFGSVGKDEAPTDPDPPKPTPHKDPTVLPIQKGGVQGNGEVDPCLARILDDACAGLSVTPDNLLAKLDPEDYADVIADPRLARQLAERLAGRRP